MNAEKPMLSIGIPFYNVGSHLREAILSVMNQTMTDWELILINDGSTDDYMSIISEFLFDERIILFDDGKNLGLPARLNQLSFLAKGKYYARMDADDIMHYRRLEKQVEYLESHPEVDVLGSAAYIIDDDNAVVAKTGICSVDAKSPKDIFLGNGFIHPSIMGKTEWFKAHLYNEKILRMQDLALWTTTVEESCFKKIPDKLLFYRAVGIPSLKRYLNTQRYTRVFLTKYSNALIPRSLWLRLYLRTYAKSVIYTMACMFGLRDKLIKRRYKKISTLEKCEAETDLQKSIANGITVTNVKEASLE